MLDFVVELLLDLGKLLHVQLGQIDYSDQRNANIDSRVSVRTLLTLSPCCHNSELTRLQVISSPL